MSSEVIPSNGRARKRGRTKKSATSKLCGQDICSFCHQSFAGLQQQDNQLGERIGPYKFEGREAYVHKNCALLCPRSRVEGSEILGVENELKRGKRLPCSVCKRTGAAVGCQTDVCKKSYHVPCAIQDGAKLDHTSRMLWCKKHGETATGHPAPINPPRRSTVSEEEHSEEESELESESEPESKSESSDDGEPTAKRKRPDNSISKACAFCRVGDESESLGELVGPFRSALFPATYVHTKCALFAPGVQCLGDTLKGVHDAIARSSSLCCSVCRKFGAVVPCSSESCRKIFHLPCALGSGGAMRPDGNSLYCAKCVDGSDVSAQPGLVRVSNNHRPKMSSQGPTTQLAPATTPTLEETPVTVNSDSATCALCSVKGNALLQGPMIGPYVVDGKPEYIHENCALFSPRVHYDKNDVLVNVDKEIMRGRHLRCSACKIAGATLGCWNAKCKRSYHLHCATAECQMDEEQYAVVCSACAKQGVYPPNFQARLSASDDINANQQQQPPPPSRPSVPTNPNPRVSPIISSSTPLQPRHDHSASVTTTPANANNPVPSAPPQSTPSACPFPGFAAATPAHGQPAPEDITATAQQQPACALCNVKGDAVVQGLIIGPFLADGKSEYIHEKCAVFSPMVHYDDSDQLVNVEKEIIRGRQTRCSGCRCLGATLGCWSPKCQKSYHMPCAMSKCQVDEQEYIALCAACAKQGVRPPVFNPHSTAPVPDSSAPTRVPNPMDTSHPTLSQPPPVALTPTLVKKNLSSNTTPSQTQAQRTRTASWVQSSPSPSPSPGPGYSVSPLPQVLNKGGPVEVVDMSASPPAWKPNAWGLTRDGQLVPVVTVICTPNGLRASFENPFSGNASMPTFPVQPLFPYPPSLPQQVFQ